MLHQRLSPDKAVHIGCVRRARGWIRLEVGIIRAAPSQLRRLPFALGNGPAQIFLVVRSIAFSLVQFAVVREGFNPVVGIIVFLQADFRDFPALSSREIGSRSQSPIP